MRKPFWAVVALSPVVIASGAWAQACPNGTVEVPRGKGATVSILRSGAEASAVNVEWLRDGTGYYARDNVQEVRPEQGKAIDYKIEREANFAPRANSELWVRIQAGLVDGAATKCMGEAKVVRMGDKSEVRFATAKDAPPHTVVTVNYRAK